MRIEEFAERYIFVRKCAGCGELMGYEEREDAFCPSCRISWERAKADGCPMCRNSMIECNCMPKKLSRAGLPFLKKLVAYRSEDAKKAENKVIYFLKRNKNKRVARFIALQLSEKVREIVSETEGSAEDFVLTYLPRSHRAVVEHGFDQSEMVCRELSGITGISMLPAFERQRRKVSEQKKLDAKQRGVNAADMFELNEHFSQRLSGRAVILFDDVVTSGASMSEALKLLRKARIADVYGLCIAFTEQ